MEPFIIFMVLILSTVAGFLLGAVCAFVAGLVGLDPLVGAIPGFVVGFGLTLLSFLEAV
jgi:uncharacterized oligopeptide transporter (OPT) family protein